MGIIRRLGTCMGLLTRLSIASFSIVSLSAALAAPPATTMLDDYVTRPDPNYGWEIVLRTEAETHTSIVARLTSQQWLTKAEVNQPIWSHWLTVVIPKNANRTGLLYIGGGSNLDEAPTGNDNMVAIARSTGSVAAELSMVPNQPLEFHGDGVPRYEDDLIGYTWDQFLEHGNAEWLARGPMIKSAVKAMDAVGEITAQEGEKVSEYVVAGGSKRGWTTWLTGAMDDRVVGIVPFVIDVLNVSASMKHHFEAYGFWAIAVGDYVDHKIMSRFTNERVEEMYDLVDPYQYRHRLDMPKLVINAAGDQFFLPDSSQFYFDELRGENYLRYVPNAEHSLQGTDAQESLIAFQTLLSRGDKPPSLNWMLHGDLLAANTKQTPNKVLLWQMTNPTARDFRTETEGRRYTSTEVKQDERGQYAVKLTPPEQGWRAYFLEFEFDVGAVVPLKLTTSIYITPDELPFEGKPLDLENSFTIACEAADKTHADRVADQFEKLISTAAFADGEARSVLHQNWAYLNWTPSGRLYAGVDEIRAFLTRSECTQVRYQLESGQQPTLPPLG